MGDVVCVMSGTKFYFASFSISGTLPISGPSDPSQSVEERKRQSIEQYLNHNGSVSETQMSSWYFGGIEPYHGLIYGKFGKTYSDEPTRYDEELGDFVERNEATTDADYSMFILDFEHRLIIFSSTHRVRHRNFVSNFEQGFSNIISNNVSIDISLIHNKENLNYVLENYPIHELEAELIPTNPGPDPAFKELDDSMQEMLVEKLGISAENFDGNGINIHEDFLDQVTSMSRSEYGESWRIVYGDDDVLKVLSSDSEPATTQIKNEVDSLGGLRNYTNQLISEARSFID